jgi:hypothetical protein
VVKRSGFDMDAFGIADRPGEVPKGTKVILSLGEENLRMLTGEVGLHRHRGHVYGEAPYILPTFSPDYFLPKRGEESSSKYTGVAIWDIRKAVKIAKEGWKKKETNYFLDPSPAKAETFVNDYHEALRRESTDLAWDLETPYKSRKQDESEVEELEMDFDILRVSFAFTPTYAMSIPWMGPWMHIIKGLLETPHPKVGWNCRSFDIPVVAKNNITVGGELYDGIDCFHLFQPSLPRRLEFVAGFYADWLKPWKHLAKTDFPFYSAADSDATIAIWLGLMKDMQAIEVPDYGVAKVA